MDFGTPSKTSDGSYYAKPKEGQFVARLNAVKFVDGSFESFLIPNLKEEIIDFASEHSKEWFGKVISKDVLSGMYDDEFDYKIDDDTAFFDENRKPIDELVGSGSVDILIELDGVWFIKKSFGPRWRIVQARVLPAKVPKECKL
jgi:hypothetical protein